MGTASGAAAQRTPPPGATAAGEPVTVTNEGSLRAGGTLRVVSARYDLTGQRELAWAGDAGRPVGNVRCTRNVRFGDGARPAARNTVLLCWRTSATRSVVTVAVSRTGQPSAAESAAVIDQAWKRLR
jgi:hypothetical protein